MKSPIAKPEAGGNAQTKRRTETIAGIQVTIICRNGVETVRGAPKCRWCSKALRPRYATERKPQESHHHYDQQPQHVPAKFDECRKQWVVISTAYRVVKRTFEGAFGTYGDNQFCGLNCGRDFGLAVAEGVSCGDLRLVDNHGSPANVKIRQQAVAQTASRRGGTAPKVS